MAEADAVIAAKGISRTGHNHATLIVTASLRLVIPSRGKARIAGFAQGGPQGPRREHRLPYQKDFHT